MKTTCLYVAMRLGDRMDGLLIVGGLVPALLIDPEALAARVAPHVGTMDLDGGSRSRCLSGLCASGLVPGSSERQSGPAPVSLGRWQPRANVSWGVAGSFVFESTPYERVSSTTTVRSQKEYARLLVERNHRRQRWENQPAARVRVEQLARKELLHLEALRFGRAVRGAGFTVDRSA